MVDKIQTQNIDFLGEEPKNTNNKQSETIMIDLPTQIAMGELNKNYNKMVNNMFATCANICLKNFMNQKYSSNEFICVENCQKKYYSTYALGEYLIKYILEESKKTDLFSSTTDVNIIENAQDKLNKIKLF